MRAKRREHQFKLDQHKLLRRIFLFERQVNFIAKNREILGKDYMHEGTETKKYCIFRN